MRSPARCLPALSPPLPLLDVEGVESRHSPVSRLWGGAPGAVLSKSCYGGGLRPPETSLAGNSCLSLGSVSFLWPAERLHGRGGAKGGRLEKSRKKWAPKRVTPRSISLEHFWKGLE